MRIENSYLGPYQLLRPIGQGGMAIVYEGIDTRIGRRVAIKLQTINGALPPGMPTPIEDDATGISRMQREARLLANLSHPNVVTIYDVGELDNRPYMVMEFLDGITLHHYIKQQGALPLHEITDILEQVARGVDAMHAAGIIHRDLKPGNIMLLADAEGNIHHNLKVKILDLGIASPTADTSLTQTGLIMGSPSYVSPERIRGQKAAPSSDIWAMGVLLYEMLSGGRGPFVGEELSTVLYRIAHEPPPALPGISSAIVKVLSTALHKNPAARFPSAEAFARAFRAAVHNEKSSVVVRTMDSLKGALVTTARPTSPRTPRRNEDLTIAYPIAQEQVPMPGIYHNQRTTTQRTVLALAATLVLFLGGASLWIHNTSPQKSASPAPSPSAMVAVSNPEPVASPLASPVASPATSTAISAAYASEEPLQVVEKPSPAPKRVASIPAEKKTIWVVKKSIPSPVPAPAKPRKTVTVIASNTAAPRSIAHHSTVTASPVIPVNKVTPKSEHFDKPFDKPSVPTAISETYSSALPPVEEKREAAANNDSTSLPKEETKEVVSSGTMDAAGVESALDSWLDATVFEDSSALMRFYADHLEQYYSDEEVEQGTVRSDKDRLFRQANQIDMTIADLKIKMMDHNSRATVRFRKDYTFKKGRESQTGSVFQELILQYTDDGWKIVSERDTRRRR